MAMKRPNEKKQYKRWLDKNAMRIMCKYCSEYETCPSREQKEKNEQEGIMTRCTHTPNKKVKKASWEKVNKKGETININKNGIPINKWFFDEKKEDKKAYRKDERQYDKKGGHKKQNNNKK